MIQERVRTGLARAKAEGKTLGRAPIVAELKKRIREALAKPLRPGVRKIAEQLIPAQCRTSAALSVG
jgi:DNA invertase Pin-like site-specific DNA recombinase